MATSINAVFLFFMTSAYNINKFFSQNLKSKCNKLVGTLVANLVSPTLTESVLKETRLREAIIPLWQCCIANS